MTSSIASTANPTDVNLYAFPLPSSAFVGPGVYSSTGSIHIFTDSLCNTEISSSATPLKFGDCVDTPFAVSIEIATLPTCLNHTTPLIVISDLQDCVPGTNGSALEVVEGNVGVCQNYNGNSVRSVQWTCYGVGTESGSASAMTKLIALGGRERWMIFCGWIIGIMAVESLLWR